MKVIVCFRHVKCICLKWWKGRDYSWHLQHLLREFGCGPFADLRTAARRRRDRKRSNHITDLRHGTSPCRAMGSRISSPVHGALLMDSTGMGTERASPRTGNRIGDTSRGSVAQIYAK